VGNTIEKERQNTETRVFGSKSEHMDILILCLLEESMEQRVSTRLVLSEHRVHVKIDTRIQLSRATEHGHSHVFFTLIFLRPKTSCYCVRRL